MAIARASTPLLGKPAAGVAFNIISWNVNGLRALMKKKVDGRNPVEHLVRSQQPAILCLQETKINPENVDKLREEFAALLPEYETHWNCCTAKKGYSGTAVFCRKAAETASRPKKKQKTLSSMFGAGAASTSEGSAGDAAAAARPVLDVSFDGVGCCEDEGRSITIEYNDFWVVAQYVPNSGQKLERLDYRVDDWDPALRAYLLQLQATKPVIWTGDLNVAFRDVDLYNPDAKHIPKVSGCTQRERASFAETLAAGPFVDTFRQQHGDGATGCYSYWSVRGNGRPSNKGLRLDYFIVSSCLVPGGRTEALHCRDEADDDGASASAGGSGTGVGGSGSDGGGGGDKRTACVHDSQILDQATVGVSDHAPVSLVLQVS